MNKYLIPGLIVVIFHLVGFFGFLTTDFQALFVKLVPFHLLLMLLMVIQTGFDRNKSFYIFFLIVALAGFFVEVIGVNTGLVFGIYEYGDTLGVKLWNTPLMIGVNWFLLVYSTGVLLQKLKIRKPTIFSVCGALIITALDILIEPVAVRFDYWSWEGGDIPLRNYLAWFIFSFALFMVFSLQSFRKVNPTAIVFIIVQFCFFIALNIWAL